MFLKKHGIEEKDLLIPASVLIGALLIAGSIWGGKISWSLGVGAGGVQDNSQNKSKVAERKDAPSEGKGKVEIIVFSDFQCPFCQQFFNVAYKEIKSKYVDTGKAKLIFRNYPLPFHQNAEKAAEAGECANRQGKFFDYHDVLFTKGQSDGKGLAGTDLKQYAKDLGLNMIEFNSCLDNGEAAEAVKQDLTAGQGAGINGTPTVFIGGKEVIGAQPFANFEKEIEAALK
jgi:protein-disulfide isomerase